MTRRLLWKSSNFTSPQPKQTRSQVPNQTKLPTHQRHRRLPLPPPPPTATVVGSSEPDLPYPERWIGALLTPKRLLFINFDVFMFGIGEYHLLGGWKDQPVDYKTCIRSDLKVAATSSYFGVVVHPLHGAPSASGPPTVCTNRIALSCKCCIDSSVGTVASHACFLLQNKHKSVGRNESCKTALDKEIRFPHEQKNSLWFPYLEIFIALPKETAAYSPLQMNPQNSPAKSFIIDMGHSGKGHIVNL
ncbi:hypothetical protein BVC80_1717g6 [Macleaya cordata]|uniref:Uncharacterized protein n=1 Tax=Macleaya cordata TaxID=56857 RepID=A0A200Q1V9_MACCD|nr:hypothetical protein BVC80_1717g6 [Macleaya cordata]